MNELDLREKMKQPKSNHEVSKVEDTIQQRLTSYACDLSYEKLSPEAIHTAKVRIMDILGALIGGFFAEPCYLTRNLAATMPNAKGATVIGTRMLTNLDMAAFVNATTARYVELMDVYHSPGAYNGHPSDVLMAVLSTAEHARVSGRDLITAVVLAYEIYQRIAHVFKNMAFDHTNFACLGAAVASGKLLGLTPSELSHCISMAVVPNNILRQVRTGHLSMFKSAASGQAARGAVFAAMLAKCGMHGPHLPFEGKAGWCDHVAGQRFSLDTMGGNGTQFKIVDSRIKLRPSVGITIASILAAEKVAPLNIKNVKQVTVEVHKRAKVLVGSGEHAWNPESRETADHSIPYVVAATLMDGTVTPKSFNDAHLWNPELRALMQKIEVVENEEFTRAHDREPPQHRMRITVVTNSGERLIGETGGDSDDLMSPKSDEEVVQKFRGLTEDVLGTGRVNKILDQLWSLEDMDDVSGIPPAFVVA